MKAKLSIQTSSLDGRAKDQTPNVENFEEEVAQGEKLEYQFAGKDYYIEVKELSNDSMTLESNLFVKKSGTISLRDKGPYTTKVGVGETCTLSTQMFDLNKTWNVKFVELVE